MQKRVRVAVNGYGVIGKRVADAIALQEDMELVGVADVIADYRIKTAIERGYSVYASTPEGREAMVAADIAVSGDLKQLLARCDVVADCTPKKVGAANKQLYEDTGIKMIWQGGEKHELAGYSFVAQVNYEGAVDRQAARVVSCNTTALCRILHALNRHGWVKRVRAVLFRRGTDPWESHMNGMINTVTPETKVPSHQGPDARTVMPYLDITTMAASGPFNLSHLHFVMVETTRAVNLDEVHQALWESPRVAFVSAADGLSSLNSVIELMRDMGRPRADMWEVAVWSDSLATDGRDLYLSYQVHNEAIVIPETIDAIRALTASQRHGPASIEMTNRSLGIVKAFQPSFSTGR